MEIMIGVLAALAIFLVAYFAFYEDKDFTEDD